MSKKTNLNHKVLHYKPRSTKVINAFTLALLIPTLIGVLADSFLHPGVLIKHLGFDSKVLLAIFTLYLIVIKTLFRPPPFPKKILSLNLHLLLPLTSILFIIFSLAETLIYPTITLNYLGIHYEEFLIVAFLFVLIAYFGLNTIKLNPLQQLAYLLTPTLLLLISIFRVTHHQQYLLLVIEDGPLEYFQFTAFLTSGIFAALIAFINRKVKYISILYLILSLGLIFIAFEEISWGQRIYDLQTPEALVSINRQDEITLHNIGPIQKHLYLIYIAIGLWGAIGHNLLNFLRFIPQQYHRLLAPHAHLSLNFIVPAVHYFASEFMFFYYELGTAERMGVGGWQEPAETFLALGFLIFTLENLIVKNSKPEF